MASTASGSVAWAEQVTIHDESVSLCLLLNHRDRTMRVVDYRSGFNPDKGALVLAAARRQGVQRVFTLVERDEISNWQRLGFLREGHVPGFYKRSDAWILGTPVDSNLTQACLEESGMRRAPGSFRDDTLAEREMQAIRRASRDADEQPAAPVRLREARKPEVLKAVVTALRSDRALTAFAPFGRDVQRRYYACTGRGGFSLMASAEIQPCFNNAFLELLSGPRTDKEALLVCTSLGLLCEELLGLGVVACFCVSPVGDRRLALAYARSGFRRTGVLHEHLLRAGSRVDAFLWTRKLAMPDDH
jgi:hypothetical protein